MKTSPIILALNFHFLKIEIVKLKNCTIITPIFAETGKKKNVNQPQQT
jgi:hypothetical protein